MAMAMAIKAIISSPMNMHFSPLTLALALLSIAISCILLSSFNSTRYTHKRLPPGSLGWPFVGENLHYSYSLSSRRPQMFYEDRRTRYGELFKTNLFGSNTVISVDPEVNKFVLLNEGNLFESRCPQASRNLFGEYTLLNVHGTLHKKLYGVAVNLMSPEKLRQHFMEDIETYVLKTLESWRDRVVLVEDDVKHFSLSLMAKQLLGFQTGKETEYLTTNSTAILKGVLSLPINIPWSTYSKGIKARKKIVKMITQVINDRRKKQSGEVAYTDILERLMAWEEFPLTDEQIVDFLLFLILAGHETTAMIIACAIKFLAECPHAIQELREEHDIVRKRRNGERLTWEDYKGMTFLRHVINETLRITNVPTILFRRALEDVELKGYTIPKGWSVLVPVLGVHLQEDLFPDPLKFNPWRWKERDIKTEPFIAFGAGPRYCAGSELGKLEVSIFLHHLVTKFDWELAAPALLSWFPLPNFPNRLPIRVKDRKEVTNVTTTT